MKNKKLLLTIGGVGCGLLLLCMLCAGVIFGVSKYLTNGATSVANEFFVDLKKDDLNAAYNKTSKAFRDATDEKEFEEFVNSYDLTKNNGVSWSSTEVKNDRANLEGKIKLPKGDSSIKMELEKENDVWKVYGFNLK